MIAIIDYGMGNLRSVEQAMRHVAPNTEVIVTDDVKIIAQAERVVFPGQGAMPDCMRALNEHGLREAVLEAAQTKPFLGICIGLQMLFEHSEEGNVAGLGLFKGEVLRFPAALTDGHGQKLKVPHMGWNQVNHNTGHPMWDGIEQGARFYYVHSYYVAPQSSALVQATSDYPKPFVCAVAQGKVFAVQFHPEKSHAAGLKLLQNFVQWKP